MPGRDQSGPQGMGPMTGRRLGICNNASESINAGYQRFGFGGGRGMGLGFRGGRGNIGASGMRGRYRMSAFQPRYGFVDDQQDEKVSLENEAAHLEKTLADIKNRIDSL